MRRILVVGGEPTSLTRFRGSLITALQERGSEVHAAAGGWNSSVAEELSAQGVQVHGFPLQRAGTNPLQDVRTLIGLWKLIRRVRPTDVLAYTAKPATFGLLAARAAGVMHRHALITGLGNIFRDGKPVGVSGRILTRLYKQSLQGADTVIFQNIDDQSTFRRLRLLDSARQTVVVAGSGVDLKAFEHSAVPTATQTIVMIARLVREKGVLTYLQAARLVRRQHPSARFLLLGDFDENPRSLSAGDIAPYVASGDVEHLGHVADVRPFIRDARMVVLPSEYGEGVPRTLLEALAIGRPVVTTDMPGCRETVRGGNGYLVPPGDVASTARAIEQILADASMATEMGRRSRLLAEEVFDVHQVNRSMIQAMGL
jgi:glycosyltransferase involved in cell wall biosynthesis